MSCKPALSLVGQAIRFSICPNLLLNARNPVRLIALDVPTGALSRARQPAAPQPTDISLSQAAKPEKEKEHQTEGVETDAARLIADDLEEADYLTAGTEDDLDGEVPVGRFVG